MEFHEQDLSALEAALGITFKDKSLLLRAVTHRSYLNENREARSLGNNELLEFLGDAVLQLVTTEHLVRTYPGESEGYLSLLRMNLVSSEALIEAGEVFEFRRYLRCSRGERKGLQQNGKARKLFADVFEAVIGAIYLDRGRMTAEMFVIDSVLPRLEEIRKREARDPKSHLQEVVQQRDGATPHYKVLKREGPDHDVIWTVALFIGSREVTHGVGNSMKEAERDAARKALSLYLK